MKQVARDNVSGFRVQVLHENVKNFHIKNIYVITELQTYFASQLILKTYKHIFTTRIMKLTKFFIANSKIKARFQKIRKKNQLYAM